MSPERVRFELELPEELLCLFDSVEMAKREAREAFVLDLLRREKISQGKAAELLGISRWDLPELLNKHNIPVFSTEPEELAQDVRALKQALKEG